MKNQPNRYWLLWSSEANSLHIEDEEQGLRTNLQAFQRNAKTDYVPIGTFPSREAATRAIADYDAVLTSREAASTLH